MAHSVVATLALPGFYFLGYFFLLVTLLWWWWFFGSFLFTDIFVVVVVGSSGHCLPGLGSYSSRTSSATQYCQCRPKCDDLLFTYCIVALTIKNFFFPQCGYGTCETP